MEEKSFLIKLRILDLVFGRDIISDLAEELRFGREIISNLAEDFRFGTWKRNHF